MSNVKMPEPFLLVADQPWGGHAEVIPSARGGEGVIDCYTTDQMEAYAAAKVREALEWQPIETAPQGQIALFYDARANEVRHCMFVDWMVNGAFCGNRHHAATHWMPLPSAP